MQLTHSAQFFEGTVDVSNSHPVIKSFDFLSATWGSGKEGGPDPAFLLLFHENPTSHTVYYHSDYLKFGFSFPEKYI